MMNQFKPFLITLFALLLLQNNLAWSNTLTLKLSPTTVEMGDVMTLQIVADFGVYGNGPDLSLLHDRFEVLGTQQSNNVSIVNGDYQTQTVWLVQMTPKKVGQFLIPSFDVSGIKNKPMPIVVTAPAHSLNKNASNMGYSFLELTLNKHTVYVQEEVIYRLRYFHLGRLLSGNVRPPVFDNALFKPLQDQRHFRKSLNGKTYEVYEWTYAFYPQKSGEMPMSGQSFTGKIQVNGRVKTVREQTAPTSITVLPKDAGYPTTQNWLPAQAVTLSENWHKPNVSSTQVRVGDSITRTITLTVDGQIASQLPRLTFADSDQFKLYADKVKSEEEKFTNGITATQTIKMAIVPMTAGDLTLPAISVNWWDTHSNTLKTVTLPAKILQVVSAKPISNPQQKPTTDIVKKMAATANHSASSPQPIASDKKEEKGQDNERQEVPTNAQNEQGATHDIDQKETAQQTTLEAIFSWQGWVWVSLALLIGWLITSAALLNKNRQHYANRKNLEKSDINIEPTHRLDVCNGSHAKDLSPHEFYNHLQRILLAQPNLVNSENVKLLTNQLKSHLFNAQPLPDNLIKSVCDAINHKIALTNKDSHKQHHTTLEDLYPK